MIALGRYFHILLDGRIERQGKILSVAGERATVQWFRFSDGEPNGSDTLPMTEHWRFYTTIDQMCTAFEIEQGWEIGASRFPVDTQKVNRFDILKRDGYRCQLCGATSEETKLEVDHKIPRAAGGSSVAENLWTLCFDCNRGKGVKSL